MIVRDEEKNLAAALETILPFADEVIINDTGSKDNTVKIATEMQTDKITVLETKWNDNFAEARNVTLDYARCGWILWLDADDRIPEETAAGIEVLKKEPLDRAYQFIVANERPDGIEGGEFYQARMFPNSPNIRFKGRVHESAARSIGDAGCKLIKVTSKIIHTGYNDRTNKILKAGRNLRLQLMDEQTTPVQIMALGHTYAILSQWKEAIEQYKKIIEFPDIATVDPDVLFSAPAEIGRCYMQLDDYQTAVEWFEAADQTNIEAVFQGAVCNEHLMLWQRAIDGYYATLACPRPIRRLSLDFHACRIYAFMFLLKLLIEIKEHSKAVALVHKMVEQYPKIHFDQNQVLNDARI